MRILKSLSVTVFTMAVMAMFGCGGGGGGGGTPQPTTATLKLLSQGTAGTKIRGIEVTVVLPPGVTVKATSLPATDTGVVVLSGATATAAFTAANAGLLNPTVIYTPATATAPGTVKILIPSAADFDLGEYVTVNTNIAAGSFPAATDFALTGFTAVDLNGAPITGVTSTIVPDIK
jgi:hypothetical protein